MLAFVTVPEGVPYTVTPEGIANVNDTAWAMIVVEYPAVIPDVGSVIVCDEVLTEST